MRESSFQSGFGGGCGLVLGIVAALVLLPLVAVVSCTAMAGGCLLVLPAADRAREAAERVRQEQEAAEAGEAPEELGAEPELEARPAEQSGEVASRDVDYVTPGKEPIEPVAAEGPPTGDETVPLQPEPPPGPSGLRTWTDSTGDYTVEATFVSATMGTVKLRKADGATIELPLERLSDSDQDWIRERGRR